jgi:hypothetical protein
MNEGDPTSASEEGTQTSPMVEEAAQGADPAQELQDHFAGTYFNLRFGFGLLGAALPLILLFAGLLMGLGLLGSISAYYDSDLRNVFVGVLVATGVCLFLYKGFSRQENLALDCAGICLVLVAFVPSSSNETVHVISAVLFFLFIAYVSIVRANDTLFLIGDNESERRFMAIYIVLGIAMIVSPLAAIAFAQSVGYVWSVVFWIEAFAMWAFAAYWILKSVELKKTNADAKAWRGELKVKPVPAGGPFPTRFRGFFASQLVERV